MKIEDFKLKIEKYKIPDGWYSINNGVKFNACILIDNKSYWECFHFDERGEYHNWTILNNEEEALDFLWKEMEENMRIFNWKPDK